MSFIKVVSGTYRCKPVENEVFKLIQGYTKLAQAYVVAGNRKDGFVIVDGTDTEGYPDKKPLKIFVENATQVVAMSNSEAQIAVEKAAEPTETDEEILERINERFNFMTTLTTAADYGQVRGFIASGPPGVGKSFEVEEALKLGSVEDKLAWDDEEEMEGVDENGNQVIARRTEIIEGEKAFRPRYTVVKGSMSALGLYCILYKHSNPREIVVLDDCDEIFNDIEALNILKAALDTGAERWLSYHKDASKMRDEGVPNKFKFRGGIIFITNADFEHEITSRPNSKRTPHFEALMSRCHYLDLTMRSNREKILRVKHVQNQSCFLSNHGCDESAASEVIEFMHTNAHKLREVSLRSAIQIAEKRGLANDNGFDWQQMVRTMDFKKEHR